MNSRFYSFPDSLFYQMSEQQGHHDEKKAVHSAPMCGSNAIDPTVESEQDPFDGLENLIKPKTVTRNYKISFEQSFMEEHEKAFQKQTENFIEQSVNQNNVTDLKQNSSIWREIDIQNQEKEDEICSMLFEQKNLFLKEISKHEKLSQFFQKIQQKVSRKALEQYYYLGYIAWSVYSDIQGPSLNESSIMDQCTKLAKKQALKLFEDERIKFLNLKQVWEADSSKIPKIKKAFESYLSFFFATIMLISEQYFSNPFSETQQPKRERSLDQSFYESDSSFYGQMHKRSH